MDLTPIFVTAVVFLGIYKILELFVRRKERLKFVDKILELPPSVLTEKLPDLKSINHLLTDTATTSKFSALKWGALAIGIGVGCIISVVTCSNLDSWRQIVTIQSGCVLTCGGVGLLLAFLIEYYLSKK